MNIKQIFEMNNQLFGTRNAFNIKNDDIGKDSFITYNNLRDDINALGTFMLYNGLEGKNIAVMGETPYEWAVSSLSVMCGVGTAVPLDKEWSLHELKVKLNAANCNCVIFSEKFQDIVWELYNDGVTPLQTFIYMNRENKENPFVSMWEAINEGNDLISFGNKSFLEMKITCDDPALVQFLSESADTLESFVLNHEDISHLLISNTNSVHKTDTLFSRIPLSSQAINLFGILIPLYKGEMISYTEI